MAINISDSGASLSVQFTVDYNAGYGIISAGTYFIPKTSAEISDRGNKVIITDRIAKQEYSILYSDVTTPSGASAVAVAALIEAFLDASAGAVPLAAGTNLIGKVSIDQATANANEVVTKTGSTTNAGGYTAFVSSTITMSVAGAYATGDYMGTTTSPQSFTSVVRTSGGTGIIKSLIISDKITTANVAMELWVFSATFTAPTDNAAWAISDAEALTVLGIIPIVTSKWYASSNNQIYIDDTINIVIKPAATSLFYALVARGTTPAFTSADITINLGILQD